MIAPPPVKPGTNTTVAVPSLVLTDCTAGAPGVDIGLAVSGCETAPLPMIVTARSVTE